MEPFGLDNLGLVADGYAAKMFQYELRRAVNDIMERPADPSKRRVVLEVVIEPGDPKNGQADRARVTFRASAKLPPQQTASHEMKVHGQGVLMFHPDSPEDVSQRTFSDDAERKPGK